MARIYLGDLEDPGRLEEELSTLGFEAVTEPPPEDPHPDELALVSAGIGVTSTFRHQLNNPLTAVLGFTELLLRRPDLTPEVERKVLQIQLNAQRVKELLQKNIG